MVELLTEIEGGQVEAIGESSMEADMLEWASVGTFASARAD